MSLLPNDYLHLVNCPEVVIMPDKHCTKPSEQVAAPPSRPRLTMTTAAKYRSSVAERGFRDTETFLISDAGSETMFVFELGVELPHFALFTQLASQEGRDRDALPRLPLLI